MAIRRKMHQEVDVRFLAIIQYHLLLSLGLLWAQSGVGNPASDEMALQMLEQMLQSPAQRQAAAKSPEARRANDYLKQLPNYAVEEMMAIVMIIMRDNRGKGFAVGMDPKTAFQQMPEQARSRLKALTKRLAQDPNFNNKANLDKIKQNMK